MILDICHSDDVAFLEVPLGRLLGQLWEMLLSPGKQVRHRAHDRFNPDRNVLPILNGIAIPCQNTILIG